jgi:N-acetyl-alpha-D-glucosaminyl L-malate synthase BshA
LKIGIVCYPTYGGSGAIAAELGQQLARRDHDVHMISYAPPFRLREFRPNLHYHAVEVSSYPLFRYPPYDLALASKIMEVVAETGLDLVHAHYAIPHALSAYLARRMLPPDRKIKLITTLHGTDITLVGTERGYYEITRFGIDNSDGVTVVSEWLGKETARIFKTRREMRVIPNFVDTARFRPDTNGEERRRFAEPDQKLLVHASNFRPVKRVMDVLRCFGIIRERMPARLILLGDGPELPGAVQLAEELGIRNDVVFAGQQDAVEGLLKSADLFLLPSEFESFGLAALEAQACGVPVIGTNAGGLAEVVQDGRTGYLCQVGEVECMAGYSIGLLEDAEKMRAFREASRAEVLARYHDEEHVRRYEEYYEEVLAGA